MSKNEFWQWVSELGQDFLLVGEALCLHSRWATKSSSLGEQVNVERQVSCVECHFSSITEAECHVSCVECHFSNSIGAECHVSCVERCVNGLGSFDSFLLFSHE